MIQQQHITVETSLHENFAAPNCPINYRNRFALPESENDEAPPKLQQENATVGENCIRCRKPLTEHERKSKVMLR